MSAPHPPSLPLLFQPGASRVAVTSGPDALVFHCPMPQLAGPATQCLARASEVTPLGDGILLGTPGQLLAGVLIGADAAAPGPSAEALYRRLFELTGGWHIHRLWNYVPDINAHRDGVENYIAFNAGRYRAFTACHGEIRAESLPAASALGITGTRLAVAFIAGTTPARQFENPGQIPSCRYPEQYGKIPPLFARGGRVDHPMSPAWHLSGTASIRGSETIGRTIGEQLAVTIANIHVVLGQMRLPPGTPGNWKIFLRHGDDLAVVRAALAREWPEDSDRMVFLRADICRADLLLEIEASFQSHSPTIP